MKRIREIFKYFKRRMRFYFDDAYRQKLIGEFLYDIAEPWPSDDIMPPPLDAQKAVYTLFYYFMGPDAYTNSPVNAKQANSEILYDIMVNHTGNKKFMMKLEEKYGSVQGH